MQGRAAFLIYLAFFACFCRFINNSYICFSSYSSLLAKAVSSVAVILTKRFLSPSTTASICSAIKVFTITFKFNSRDCFHKLKSLGFHFSSRFNAATQPCVFLSVRKEHLWTVLDHVPGQTWFHSCLESCRIHDQKSNTNNTCQSDRPGLLIGKLEDLSAWTKLPTMLKWGRTRFQWNYPSQWSEHLTS